ncbi:response regulator FixJ [Magnetospirillum aberrantis]|uniref:Response regulator n=1 Tax=Magnetospirillum aberrantis SpK TaxID=908842 RepID=A0A7C9QUM1_9PROT|nr:response regulator FixJ [Magnetospirillum aberrantis]NFV81063.1 response regulator [Magnetospirillum aberrantis SpK]
MIVQPVVHVVDDDGAIRDALVLLLEAAGHAARAHADAASFLAVLDPAQPGCVVADVRMPGMSGLELLRHLGLSRIDLPVIIITGHADVAMAVEALKAGAADFIEKPFDEDVLLSAVERALDRGARAFRERRHVDEIAARAASLTPREREVMDLVVQGMPNKAVAVELSISARTVEIHRARVMEKMAAASLSDLVRMALRLDEGDGV